MPLQLVELLQASTSLGDRTFVSWLDCNHVLVIRSGSGVKCLVAAGSLCKLAMDATTTKPHLVPLRSFHARRSLLYNRIDVSQGITVATEFH
jgi:hypothetical protein